MARPRRHADTLDAALVLLDAGDREGAVDVSGMSLPTLYRRKAERDAGKAPSKPSPPSGKPASTPTPASPPARQPEAVAGPSGDPWWALGEILAARAPELDAVVEAGLVVYQREGPAGLRAWLGAPKPDPLSGDQRQAILDAITAGAPLDAILRSQRVRPERWAALLLADRQLAEDVDAAEGEQVVRLHLAAANLAAENAAANREAMARSATKR